jgi:cytochrome P450
MIIAGHDTTAATLTWMFWELAKDSKTQARIRAEIQETRQRAGAGVELTGPDYDSMTFLNASLKVNPALIQCV